MLKSLVRKVFIGQYERLAAELHEQSKTLTAIREQLAAMVPLRHELAAATQRFSEMGDRILDLQGASGEALSQMKALRKEVEVLKENEIDYQLLMLQQQQLAQLTDLEPHFRSVYEACRRFTMTSVERLYSLHNCVDYVSRSTIPGDLAECGVWRGGSCMLMAHVLLTQRDTERKLYMFDTYEGHPRPNADMDVDIWGNRAIDEWERRKDSDKEWGAVSLDEVRRNLLSTGYPADRLVFVKGMIEETILINQPE